MHNRSFYLSRLNSKNISQSFQTKNNATLAPYNVSLALTRVEKIVKVVESGLPYLIEYAPVVRSLPKLYNLMKAFNDEAK